jgi:hypothetical protein
VPLERFCSVRRGRRDAVGGVSVDACEVVSPPASGRQPVDDLRLGEVAGPQKSSSITSAAKSASQRALSSPPRTTRRRWAFQNEAGGRHDNVGSGGVHGEAHDNASPIAGKLCDALDFPATRYIWIAQGAKSP